MPEDYAEEPMGDDENGEEENFAELLESYSSGVNDDLQVGDKVTVKIISVSADTVFVDTGTKIDGAVDIGDLRDEDGRMPYEEGDSLELYVVEMTESEVRLSRALSGIGGQEMLQDAYDDKIPVEGKVLETCKGGFRVEVMKRKAFCPISQMDLKYIETPETFLGQAHQFLITRLTENGKNVVVSRRRLLEKEQQKAKSAFMATIHSGDILTGTVSRIMPYGAFVELVPGLEGMVHISELSWTRVQTTEDVVAPGEQVTVRIIGIETGEDGSKVKLALSMKQAQGDPWETVDTKFKVGDKLKGKVTRCMDFGVFVEIAPGIEGLVHVSEMSYVRRILKPEDVVSAGETVGVVIKEFNPDKRRISLSMRDAEGDPWVDVPDKYKAGQRVEGVVQKVETFGIFVNLEPGVTGLLHKSKIRRSAKPSAIESLKPGRAIPVVIEKIEAKDRRISLDVGDAAEEGDWKQYASGGQSAMGSLGEQLQQALAKKK